MTVLPATILMGGVFPLTMRIAAGGPRLGRARRRARLRAQHRRRDRRLVPLGVRRAAEAGAAARDLRRRAGRSDPGRACCSPCAPGAAARRRAGGRGGGGGAGAHRPGAAALEPGQLLVRLLPGVDRARVHQPQAAQARLEGPQAGLLRGRHRHHGHRRPVGARPTRSRTTARSTPRTTPTCRRRSWSASCRCCFYHGATPPKVALVGFGSGVTAGAITQFPIESLEVVELEPAIYRASRFFDNDNHRPLENPQGHGARRRRAQLPDPAQGQVRRHRQRAVEPLAHRRVEPVHARVLPRASRRASRPTGSSASGRSSTRWRPGTSRPSTAPCARSSPTSTSSPPRICRRTPSWSAA